MILLKKYFERKLKSVKSNLKIINNNENRSEQLKLIDCITTTTSNTVKDDQLWLVMEYCGAGSVTDLGTFLSVNRK